MATVMTEVWIGLRHRLSKLNSNTTFAERNRARSLKQVPKRGTGSPEGGLRGCVSQIVGGRVGGGGIPRGLACVISIPGVHRIWIALIIMLGADLVDPAALLCN